MYDRRSIRGAHLVDRFFQRSLVWLQHVRCHYAHAFAFALVLVTLPARSEWSTTTDRNIIAGIEQYTSLLVYIEDYLFETEQHTQNTATNTAYIANLLDGSASGGTYTQLQTLIGHVDDLETLVGMIQEQTVKVTNINDKLNAWNTPILNMAATILAMKTDTIILHQLPGLLGGIQASLDQLELNTETGSSGVTAAGPVFVTPGLPGAANTNAPTINGKAEPTTTFSQGQPETFEDPQALSVDPFEWEPPTRTGLQTFGVNVPLASLGAAMEPNYGIGPSTTEVLSFTTDFSWYSGDIRTAIFAGVTAFAVFFGAWMVFEEFRRTA